MSVAHFFRYPSATLDYLANVSDRHRYLYLAIPKAASTGILHALQLAEVENDPRRLPQFVHDRNTSPLKSPTTSAFGAENLLRAPDVFRFTYVRNPYTRILSAYLDKIVHERPERERLLPGLGFSPDAEVSFRDFLLAILGQRDGWRDIHWSTQTRLLQLNNVGYSYIGRFESFAESFPPLLDRLGIDRAVLDNVTPPRHGTRATALVDQYIGPEERDLIQTIYEADFEMLCYGRDPGVAHL